MINIFRLATSARVEQTKGRNYNYNTESSGSSRGSSQRRCLLPLLRRFSCSLFLPAPLPLYFFLPFHNIASNFQRKAAAVAASAAIVVGVASREDRDENGEQPASLTIRERRHRQRAPLPNSKITAETTTAQQCCQLIKINNSISNLFNSQRVSV